MKIARFFKGTSSTHAYLPTFVTFQGHGVVNMSAGFVVGQSELTFESTLRVFVMMNYAVDAMGRALVFSEALMVVAVMNDLPVFDWLMQEGYFAFKV